MTSYNVGYINMTHQIYLSCNSYFGEVELHLNIKKIFMIAMFLCRAQAFGRVLV